jgi:hypothetical protein
MKGLEEEGRGWGAICPVAQCAIPRCKCLLGYLTEYLSMMAVAGISQLPRYTTTTK